MRRSCVAAVLILATTGSAAAADPEATGTGGSIRPLVSRLDDREEGIWWAHITGTARTAFVWTRADLLPDLPATDRYRLFAVDIATDEVRLVSDDGRFKPEAVSHDGNFVVGSYELDSRDETAVVIDAASGAIHALDMPEPLTSMREASISADGSTVAFAATTGRGDTLRPNRLFMADVASGAVTEPLAGADGALFDLHLNEDGTILAMASQATNLGMEPGGRGSNPVIYDRVQGTLEYAYTTIGGVADGQSVVDGISADGSKVLVQTGASNLVGVEQTSGPTNDLQPFVFDRATGVLTPIEVPELESARSVVADHSADLGVIAIRSTSSGVALRHAIAENTSVSIYGPAVEPDGPLWTAALDPISMDDSGDVVVLLSEATNLGPDRDSVTDAFIVGAGSPDPSADVYVPPPVPLPPDLLTIDTITPEPIEPPTSTSVPSTTVPPTTVPPTTEPTTTETPTTTSVPVQNEPDRPDEQPPARPRPPRSNPFIAFGCEVDGALGLDLLSCEQTSSTGSRVVAAILRAILRR